MDGNSISALRAKCDYYQSRRDDPVILQATIYKTHPSIRHSMCGLTIEILILLGTDYLSLYRDKIITPAIIREVPRNFEIDKLSPNSNTLSTRTSTNPKEVKGYAIESSIFDIAAIQVKLAKNAATNAETTKKSSKAFTRYVTMPDKLSGTEPKEFILHLRTN